MQCPHARELLSARLDGELAPADRPTLDTHLETCADCRAFADAASELHRSVRVRAAVTVPDLAPAVLAGPAPALLRRRQERVLALRYSAGALGLTQLVLAWPELLGRETGAEVHLSRHLGTFVVAFAAGLLVAGFQPWRARGMVPMVAVLVGATLVMSVLDVTAGRAAAVGESAHLLELAGLVVIWLIGRGYPLAGSPDGAARPGSRQPSPAPLAAPGPRSVRSLWTSTSMSLSMARTRSSRARATRERIVPTGQPHTSAASA